MESLYCPKNPYLKNLAEEIREIMVLAANFALIVKLETCLEFVIVCVELVIVSAAGRVFSEVCCVRLIK